MAEIIYDDQVIQPDYVEPNSATAKITFDVLKNYNGHTFESYNDGEEQTEED